MVGFDRRLDLQAPKVLAGTSQAVGRLAHRPLSWWHRRHRGGRRRPVPGPAPEPVKLAVAGAVATVTLNRPERRNALDLACWQALAGIAAGLAADPAVRVVVLTGQVGEHGGVFSSGSDIAEFPEARLGTAAAREYNERYEGALRAWAALPQPVIAAIAGYCLGAALELALTADFRVAAADAVFGVPAVKLGIGISVADARRLIDVVGAARARRLLLSGEPLTAEQALAVGLVDEVVPVEALPRRVDELVQLLLANAPRAMAWAKQAIDFAVRHPDGEPFTFDVLGTEVFATRDCAEGVAAFLARRPPQFTGN